MKRMPKVARSRGRGVDGGDSSRQLVYFLILKRDERSPRERLCYSSRARILPMKYTTSKNPSSTHYKFRQLINNMSFTRVDESPILT